jgi:type I restriction enzyme S subunit
LKYVGNLYGGLTGKSGEDFKQEDNPNNKPYIPYTNIFRNTYISKNHVDYVVLGEGENQNKVQKFDLFFLMSSETYQDLGKPCILVDDIEELYLNSFCKGFRVNRIDISPLFLNYQLLGSVHKELISIEGRGFTRINLRQDRLNETPIFLPPLNEQLQIVQFLDEKTELIDKLISVKERKITLLKEQRTSLINQVVTKGLNPNVKMKDSGVKWIGDIPEGWMMSKFKFDTKTPVQYGLNISGDKYLEEGIRFIRITDLLEGGGLIPEDGKYLDIKDVPSEFLLNKFDILFCRTGHTVGKSYLHLEDGNYTSGGYLVRFNFGNYFQSKFIFYISKTSFYWDWIKLNSVISTIENVNGDKYQNFQYPKPSKSEQKEIVEFLDTKLVEIDDLVHLEQKKIDLLKEYRQSLISEVVTGKIKVTTDE